jgi:prophage antirepressor-like protein
MNQVIPFNFENHPVRTVVFDETPWWVGRDVCEALEYQKPLRAIKLHCKGAPKWGPLQTEGGIQKVRIISIGDVFRLIANCNLPEGERFERWIFDTVLPEIASTGAWLPEGMMAVPIRWFETIEAKVDKLFEEKDVRDKLDRCERSKKRATPKDLEEIRELHKAGYAKTAISKITYRGSAVINNALREAVDQPSLFDDEPSESFGGPLEAPWGHDGGAA